MGGGVVKLKIKNKGFTLAELLAVITILAIIALIIFPAVNKTIKSSKEKAYQQQIESILESAENWTLENMSSLSDTTDNYVTIEELQQSGYLEAKTVINPKTDEKMNGCVVISYDESYNQYTYRYEDESCSYITAVPIIILNGDTSITIGKGETFTDPGYSATYRGNDITSSVIVSGEVNTDEVGTYTLEYSVTYDGKDALTVSRTVVVELVCDTEILGKDITTGEVVCLDPDANPRYVGADPDNYVEFNGELWRIIGKFNGQVKIISNEKINNVQFDEDDESDWSQASLQTYLNNDYLNNIEEISKSYIDQEYVWNIGGAEVNLTRSEFYSAERGNNVYGGRTTTWIGAIGLIYPSDFGYASSGDYATCASAKMINWSYFSGVSDYPECYNNSWLNGTASTLTSFVNESNRVFTVSSRVTHISANETTFSAAPVLYLNSNVIITGGTGDSVDPFILGTN